MSEILFPPEQSISEALEEYQALAIRTEARIDIKTGDITELLPLENDFRLLHAALGLSGEMLELLEAMGRIEPTDGKVEAAKLVNRRKGDKWFELAGELGDLVWYAALLADSGSDPLTVIARRMCVSRLATVRAETLLGKTKIVLQGAVCRVVDNAKGAVYYHRSNEARQEACRKAIRDTIPDILFALGFLFDSYFTLEDQSPWANLKWLMRTNIAKLAARYPDKFTSDGAANRDTEAEFNAIATAE
jgi:NTP pyrophosphatase (non-canonical NTP hydrolase)